MYVCNFNVMIVGRIYPLEGAGSSWLTLVNPSLEGLGPEEEEEGREEARERRKRRRCMCTD